MTQFSSRPPFNDDPEPWQQRVTNKRISATDHGAKMSSQKRGVAARALAYAYIPRPKFDRPQHNPTNPILAAFRKYVVDPYDGGLAWCADTWLRALGGQAQGYDAQFMADEAVVAADPDRDPPRHMADAWTDHARRVLTRLANLTKESV